MSSPNTSNTPSPTPDSAPLLTNRVKVAGALATAATAYAFGDDLYTAVDQAWVTKDEATWASLGVEDPDSFQVNSPEGCSVGCGTASLGLALALVVGANRKRIADLLKALKG